MKTSPKKKKKEAADSSDDLELQQKALKKIIKALEEKDKS